MRLQDCNEVRQASFNEFMLKAFGSNSKEAALFRESFWNVWCLSWEQASLWAVDAACDHMCNELKGNDEPDENQEL